MANGDSANGRGNAAKYIGGGAIGAGAVAALAGFVIQNTVSKVDLIVDRLATKADISMVTELQRDALANATFAGKIEARVAALETLSTVQERNVRAVERLTQAIYALAAPPPPTFGGMGRTYDGQLPGPK